MKMPWGSNVVRDGRLISQQYVVAEAIDKAIAAERERCAEIAHTMARALKCRDKIRADADSAEYREQRC